MGSYRYRSLIEDLCTLYKAYRSPIYPKLPTCSWQFANGVKNLKDLEFVQAACSVVNLPV